MNVTPSYGVSVNGSDGEISVTPVGSDRAVTSTGVALALYKLTVRCTGLGITPKSIIVGLTHVGYSPYGDEVDSDVILAEQVAGADVLIGGHSHSTLNPAVRSS